MPLIEEKNGKFVVRQGTPPFPALRSFDTRAQAQEEVARLQRENNPAPGASGAAASRQFKAALKPDSDVAVRRTDKVLTTKQSFQTKAPIKKPKRTIAEGIARGKSPIGARIAAVGRKGR